MAEYNDVQLAGIFGALKKVGGFVAKKVVPGALQFVPVVGGAASEAYSSIPGIRSGGPPPIPPRVASRPASAAPWYIQAAQDAAARAAADRGVREAAVKYTARYAPPQLLAAAAARQARGALPAIQEVATGLLPVVAVGAILYKLTRGR